MSTLNILCAICSEFYKSDDVVYATTACGHLFHHRCLMRWLSRSNTCPQCRRSCHRHRIHRIFLNFSEPTEWDGELEELVDNHPNWVPLEGLEKGADGQLIMTGAIKSGTDPEGNDAYVARVYFEEDLLPANFIPALDAAYAPWGCQGHFLRSEVEILINGDYIWVEDENGHVPPNAVATGYAESGETLYTGRAQYENILLPGKVHPSHHVMYMPYRGQEVNTNRYEVLVQVQKQKVQSEISENAATVGVNQQQE